MKRREDEIVLFTPERRVPSTGGFGYIPGFEALMSYWELGPEILPRDTEVTLYFSDAERGLEVRIPQQGTRVSMRRGRFVSADTPLTFLPQKHDDWHPEGNTEEIDLKEYIIADGAFRDWLQGGSARRSHTQFSLVTARNGINTRFLHRPKKKKILTP